MATIAELQALLQPTKQDRSRDMAMGLLNFGSGILANNRGNYGALGPALGAGLQQGLQGYQQSQQMGRTNRVQDLLQKMELEKYAAGLAQEEQKKQWMGSMPQPTYGFQAPASMLSGQPTDPMSPMVTQQAVQPTPEATRDWMVRGGMVAPEQAKTMADIYKSFAPEKPEKPVEWKIQATDKGLIQVNPLSGETRPLGYGTEPKPINPLVEAKIAQGQEDKVRTKEQQSLSAQQVLDQAAKLYIHPGKSMATGASSFMANIPGTEAKGFQANLNTFKAQTFVPMVSALKGMGALSDAEGKKLSESVGALDPSMPEEEFNTSMRDITKYLYDKAKAAGLNVNLPSFAMEDSKAMNPDTGSYDTSKESRYQAWKAKQGR